VILVCIACLCALLGVNATADTTLAGISAEVRVHDDYVPGLRTYAICLATDYTADPVVVDLTVTLDPQTPIVSVAQMFSGTEISGSTVHWPRLDVVRVGWCPAPLLIHTVRPHWATEYAERIPVRLEVPRRPVPYPIIVVRHPLS